MSDVFSQKSETSWFCWKIVAKEKGHVAILNVSTLDAYCMNLWVWRVVCLEMRQKRTECDTYFLGPTNGSFGVMLQNASKRLVL